MPSAGDFVSDLTKHIDCQAQALGSGAWDALAAPGSTLSLVLSGFLTIFIALLGYKLLVGEQLTVRSGTVACVKIGAIFALATSWPAYRTLVYDVVTDGPMQLVAEIGPRASIAGSDGTLMQRLDLCDQELAQLAILGEGDARQDTDALAPPPPFVGFDSFAFGGSRILFELTAVSGLSIVRVITGLMLGFGPFFIAFLMFDSTRSLFEGWVRVLAGTALAAIGVSVALGLELALMEPWLADVVARRAAGETMPNLSAQLLVIVCLFSILVAAALHSSARVARTFRLAALTGLGRIDHRETRAAAFAIPPGMAEIYCPARTEPTRVATISSAILAMSRRERADLELHASASTVGRPRTSVVAPLDGVSYAPGPIGRSFRRPPHHVSALAGRRDRRA